MNNYNLKFDINKELIAYALAFVSFVIPKIEGLNEIILFGSVTRGESDKDSDIDLFFNIEKNQDDNKIKKMIDEELKRFYKSKIAEIWYLKGIKNAISIQVGKLDEWKLKRSLISDGICLYGKYKEIPENMKDFVLFNIKPIKNVTKRNKVIREIFGRKEGKYLKKGILAEVGGKRVSPSSFIIPKEHSQNIIVFLRKEKVDYWFFELWTDELSVAEGLVVKGK